MKLFDRIFHPEKIEALEKCAKQWEKVSPVLTYEQIKYLEYSNFDKTLFTVTGDKEFYSISNMKLFKALAIDLTFVSGRDYMNFIKAKIQLDSLKEIGLTDEQKLYLELIEGDNNNE